MELDDSQRFAVNFPLENSIFITAPPGYGKTHVITERIKHIISKGQIRPPKKILALTFSNAAANEMKSRINREIPQADFYVDIMNFHTLSYHLLKVYGNYVGVERNFTVINEEIEYQFKMKFFEELGWLHNEYDGQKCIDGYNRWYSEKFLANNDIEPQFREYNELKNKIETELISKDQLNFDYILFKSRELLIKHPKIKDIFFNKYMFILADEFQDTNFIQYCLFKEISTNSNGKKRNVFVVGDEKQAIMKFQGANPKNIMDLIEDFDCTKHELKENHRTASAKIKTLTDRLRYSTNNGISDPFEVYVAIKSNESEDVIKKVNSAVINKIFELQEEKSAKLEDICILFPLEKTPNELKKALNESGINYIQITDYNFRSINKKYSELFKEVLNLIEKRYNKSSVGAIIKKTIETYYSNADEDLVLITIKNFSKRYDGDDYSSFKTWENLQEFYNHIQIDIDWTKMIRSRCKDRVFLSTIHSAKGLEFKYIFMIGIVHFQIPHHTICNKCNPYNNYSKKLEIPDSKDLFYVGVSRAIEDLFFFFGNQEFNSKGELKKRKISCVFEDMADLSVFIDIYRSRKYDYDSNRIKKVLCKYGN